MFISALLFSSEDREKKKKRMMKGRLKGWMLLSTLLFLDTSGSFLL